MNSSKLLKTAYRSYIYHTKENGHDKYVLEEFEHSGRVGEVLKDLGWIPLKEGGWTTDESKVARKTSVLTHMVVKEANIISSDLVTDVGDEARTAYLAIFRLDPEYCKIEGVKYVGKTYNESSERVYKFIAIVTSPVPDFVSPNVQLSSNEWIVLQNDVRAKLQDVGGPSVNCKVKWEVFSKRHNKKTKKHFDFGVQLESQSVLGFEIIAGTYYIKSECWGLFY